MKAFEENPHEDIDELPLTYDVTRIQRYWDQRPLEVVARTAQIMRAFVPFLSQVFLWEYLIRGKIRHHAGLQKKYAIRLRQILTDLGPCFIKLGQALSIRPDLLPSSVLFELQKLCDAVPSFPTEDAIQMIQVELQQSVDDLFHDLTPSTQPVAAASLGQVYQLTLKDEHRSRVAVKVQRPDMLASVLKDLYIMRKLAQTIQGIKSVLTHQRPYDVALLDAFASASLMELDYVSEAGNQERFIRELEPKMRGQIYIPRVFPDLTTRKVLVTEWIEGRQLAKSSPEVINRLTPVGVQCFLIQLLETGFFHADPHPGNLLVTRDGRLALIDFGLCAEVPLPDTQVMTVTIVHLMQGDVGGLIQDAIALQFLPADVNVGKLQPELQKVFDSAQLAMEAEFRQEQLAQTQYKAVVTRRKRFMAVSYDLNKIFFEYPFLVPDYFALITRAMIVLEGIAVTGDPGFDLFNSAYPYALKRAVSLFGVSNMSQIAQEAITHMRKKALLSN
eukprot:TCALIF_03392-PA protein Name:"Similar to sll0005 Uncharacterized protein sll0005 (Synechocystis sp. (strain PCC 6803 / Kazusa))" AED:0.01 eAED:0.01 QI:0/0/0/0.5/1/1/2/0/501